MLHNNAIPWADVLGDMWLFDLEALSWTDVSATVGEYGPVPSARFHMGIAQSDVDALLYIFGGEISLNNGSDSSEKRPQNELIS